MRKSFLIAPAILILSQIPVLADVVPRGATVEVRPNEAINVSRWDRGRIYPAHVTRDVLARDGDVVIPRGSYAELIVRETGPGQYTLDLESITAGDRRYALDTAGPQYNMSQENYNNGNGLVGAIVGAIAGANGERVESRGDHIFIPPDSVLTFQLQQPLFVTNWRDPGYDQGGHHYHREHDWYR